MIDIIIAVVLGVIAYFLSAQVIGLTFVLSVLIGIAVGLLYYFGITRRR